MPKERVVGSDLPRAGGQKMVTLRTRVGGISQTLTGKDINQDWRWGGGSHMDRSSADAKDPVTARLVSRGQGAGHTNGCSEGPELQTQSNMVRTEPLGSLQA